MKTRITEKDLTRIVRRVIKEEREEKKSFDLDTPFLTYRQIVQSILSDISLDVAKELDVKEYDGDGEIPDYLKPYVDEVLEYVKDNDEMMLKLWDGIHDAIMFTPIHDKIYDDIISDNEY
jgi:hypothetical protein